jgi:multisubunit Na+/H+ antiporter MnhE subunit
MNLSLVYWLLLGSVTWFSLTGKADTKALALGLPVLLSAWALSEHLSDVRTRVPREKILSALKSFWAYLVLVVVPAVVQGSLFIARCSFGTKQLEPALLALAPPGASPESLILMAVGISMSPDQQVVAIDDRRLILYVHFMHAPDPEVLRQSLLEQHRRYIRKATPP